MSSIANQVLKTRVSDFWHSDVEENSMLNSSLGDSSSSGYSYMKTNRSTEKKKKIEEENTEKKKKRRRLVAEDQIVHQHQIAHPDRSVLLPSSPTRSSSLALHQIAHSDCFVLLSSSPTISFSLALRSSGFVFLQVRQKSSL